MRDSMVFYRSFYEALRDVDNDTKAILYDAIFDYGLNFKEPELTGIAKTVFTLIRPQITANIRKFENGQKGAEHGHKGGRPPSEEPLNNPTETPQEPLNNPTKTPNVNANANDNDNANVNDNDKKNELLPTGNAPLVFSEKLNKAMNSIIPYLNEKAGTSFKANNKATVRLISARLKEGYGWHDFKAVIDGKTAEWIGSKEMKQYLRPSTLFGTKFESYVQAAKPPIINPENPAKEDRNNQRGNIRFASPIL